METIKKYFLIFASVILFTEIADRILFVVFPTYLIQRNFSATQIGLIFSIAGFFLIIARIYIGKLSDIFGRKGIMSLGLFVSSIVTFLFPFAKSIYHFIFLRGLKDSSETFVTSVETAIHADVFRKKIRAKIMGKLGSVMPLGRAIATILGFSVLTWLTIEYSFYLSGLLVLFAFFVLTYFFKEKRHRIREGFRILLNPLRYSKVFNVLVLIAFMQSLTFGMAYLPGFFILAENYLKISPSMLFVLFFIAYAISTPLVYPSGKIIDKIGRRKATIIGVFLFNLLAFMYPLTKNIFQFALVLTLISIAYYTWRVAFKTALMDETKPKIRGEQIGYYKTMDGIGMLAGPAIGGFLIDAISIQAPFIFAGIVGMLFATIIYFSRIFR